MGVNEDIYKGSHSKHELEDSKEPFQDQVQYMGSGMSSYPSLRREWIYLLGILQEHLWYRPWATNIGSTTSSQLVWFPKLFGSSELSMLPCAVLRLSTTQPPNSKPCPLRFSIKVSRFDQKRNGSGEAPVVWGQYGDSADHGRNASYEGPFFTSSWWPDSGFSLTLSWWSKFKVWIKVDCI